MSAASRPLTLPHALRYLALGDSYTIGEGVRAGESFPFQLCARLRQSGIALQEPTVLARTGWTSADLGRAIQAAPPHGTFELVTLLVGVNNQYQGLDIESFRAELRDLLAQAIAFAGGKGGRVLTLSIPDWSQTPFGRDEPGSSHTQPGSSLTPGPIWREIDAFNQVNREEASRAGTRFVEITSLSRENGSSPDWITGDGLHPSGRQYAAWVERILPAALAALAQPVP